MEEASISSIIEEVKEIFRIPVTKKELTFDFKVIDSVSTTVRTNYNKILQILIHLMHNATKYTFTGGITLEVRKGEKDLIEICVRDTGIGIEKTHLKRL